MFFSREVMAYSFKYTLFQLFKLQKFCANIPLLINIRVEKKACEVCTVPS